jgi:DNA helicase-2/ATP-dependent DNA helicase PcrA
MDSNIQQVLSKLNPQQRKAATHGLGPLLIVAGAGTGKTATLVHRVAWLIAQGIEPNRILLLTFTRRAAAEMLRRADGLLRQLKQFNNPHLEGPPRSEPPSAEDAEDTAEELLGAVASLPRQSPTGKVWGGTFHAVATRLLRRYGKALGLPPGFTIHDQSDSEDLMGVVRAELGLAKTSKRFPTKGTCLAIYSRCVNAQEKLDQVLARYFPWCKEWEDELKRLFDAYVDHKAAAATLDYDDLLLYWRALLDDPSTGEKVRTLFDCVLVDEYQDTNRLQAEIIYRLCPTGRGLTVVGDDAQSIYGFRAATVHNILDFPKHYPDATVLALEQNYRSTTPILDAANHVIELSPQRFTKNLWSRRAEGEPPWLVTCEDENDQASHVVARVLDHREKGIDLRRQAVLFRASHHSMVLESELAQRNIPFRKYGGLKFVEAAHVKDLLAFLRLAENPCDVVAGMRLLCLLPGLGPVKARRLMGMLQEGGGHFAAWRQWRPPKQTTKLWSQLLALLESLASTVEPLPAQLHLARRFYTPLAEQIYDNPEPRLRDLEQLELIAARYANRARMLADLTLDPPASTQDLAGQPRLDDDYLVLSTIHSAKGLEWDVVYVIHASDGNIPSDMATRDNDQIEEERRLFYVALTRAKSWLYVCFPLHYYYSPWSSGGRAYGLAQRTRFITNSVARCFQVCATDGMSEEEPLAAEEVSAATTRLVRGRMKRLWR